VVSEQRIFDHIPSGMLSDSSFLSSRKKKNVHRDQRARDTRLKKFFTTSHSWSGNKVAGFRRMT
jgi:hypothetical protein